MRDDVSIETYERLFAESGGLCAKPGCGTVLFGSSSGFVGEAFAVAGTPVEGRESARGNPASAENLVLLCPACGGEARSGSLAPGEPGRWKGELGARPSAEIAEDLRRALCDREMGRRADAIGKFRFFPEFGVARRAAAKDVAALLELLEGGELEVLDRGQDSAGCPSAEPEADFAALAAEAKRRGGGVVVRAAPPARWDGFLAGESEDVSGRAGLSVGCAPVVRKLREKGCLSAAAERGALARLGFFETPPPEEPPIEDGASLYLDSSSAAALSRLGILGEIRPAGLSAAVSRETASLARAAVRREELSGEIVGVAKRLRLALGSRIRSGRIKTVASPAAGGSPFGHPPAALLALSDGCDAVVTDDGFFIRKGRVGEGGSSARAVSTLDVLETLVSSGSVADEERREMLARLRAAEYPLPSGAG